MVGTGVRLLQMALVAQPRSYKVRLYCEDDKCTYALEEPKLRVTVDVRDGKTNQTREVRTIHCSEEDAAEHITAFTARHVFLEDQWTPRWSVGSDDGEDLAAYLRLQCYATPRTYPQVLEQRCKQLNDLRRAAFRSPDAAIVRYELASLRDLEGEHLEALRLHLMNRALHPSFVRGRLRFAMCLSMVSGGILEEEWSGTATREFRDALYRYLQCSGLLQQLGDRAGRVGEVLRGQHDHLESEDARQIRLALLDLAEAEFRELRRQVRYPRLAARDRSTLGAGISLRRGGRGMRG